MCMSASAGGGGLLGLAGAMSLMESPVAKYHPAGLWLGGQAGQMGLEEPPVLGPLGKPTRIELAFFCKPQCVLTNAHCQ